MKYYTQSLDNRLKVMAELNITSAAYDVLLCLWLAQEEEGQIKYLKLWKEANSGPKLIEALQELKDKHILLKDFIVPKVGDSPDWKNIPINKTRLKTFIRHSNSLGSELFNAYPDCTAINGKTVILKNIGNFFEDLDAMYFKYGKAIGFSVEKHREIMEIVEHAANCGCINVGIEKFIRGEMWNAFANMIENGVLNKDVEISFV
jgi:hypothetical protein